MSRLLEPLGLLDRWIWRGRRPIAKPVFLILGLPRSGTTLVYQYAVHRLELSYFPNPVGLLPMCPCAVTWLLKRSGGSYVSDFRSRYGKVKGLWAPREAGAFWGRHFGYENYLEAGEIADGTAEELRRVVAAVQRIFGGSAFINKNVKHLLRIQALAQIFPTAHFIVVDRPQAAVALSILKRRQESPREEWFSVKPENYAALKDLPLHEQVAGQVLNLSARLEADLKRLPPARFTRLDYADFCRRPEILTQELLRVDSSLQFKNPAASAFEASSPRPWDLDSRRLIEAFPEAEDDPAGQRAAAGSAPLSCRAEAR
jgi:hypothetical protein